MRQRLFFALPDVIDAFVVSRKCKKEGQDRMKLFVPEREASCLQTRGSYPLMFTNRSSAALWMWKTSSLNRQRQVELCRASFHRDRAAASLFSMAWHRMKPTAGRTGRKVTSGEQFSFLWNSRGSARAAPVHLGLSWAQHLYAPIVYQFIKRCCQSLMKVDRRDYISLQF